MNRGDDYIFHAGDINGHKVVIATLQAGQESGTSSSAALASQIKKFFPNLWFGLLVGVAAGLPNLSKTIPIYIHLGDVVGLPQDQIAGLIAYELGKETSTGEFQLLRSGHVLANTEGIVRSAIGGTKLRAPYDDEAFLPIYETIRLKEHSSGTFEDPGQDKDNLYFKDNDGVERLMQRGKRPQSKRTRVWTVWYGPIGSGDKLVKSSRKRDELRDAYNLIGLDKGAAGIMNQIPVGVVRGVCDYADEHENREWQPYAAAMAASYAKAILHEVRRGKSVPKRPDLSHQTCTRLILPPKTGNFYNRKNELSEIKECLGGPEQNQTKAVLSGNSSASKNSVDS